jgi:undecaprenyl-diphosphatase
VLDRAWVLRLNEFAATHWLVAICARVFAQYVVIFFPGLLVWLWWAKGDSTRRIVLVAIGAAILALAVNFAIGHLLFRPRPFLVLPVRALVAHPARDASFPSDHAAVSGAVVAALWRGGEHSWSVVSLGVGLALGLARVMVGVHYPSDILAGLGIGILCGMLGSWITGLLRPLLGGVAQKAEPFRRHRE